MNAHPFGPPTDGAALCSGLRSPRGQCRKSSQHRVVNIRAKRAVYHVHVNPMHPSVVRWMRFAKCGLSDRWLGTKSGKRFRSINKKTRDLFQAYDWPGNIRELQNVIERAVILREVAHSGKSSIRQAHPHFCPSIQVLPVEQGVRYSKSPNHLWKYFANSCPHSDEIVQTLEHLLTFFTQRCPSTIKLRPEHFVNKIFKIND
jgi:hypothetical protein